MIPTAIVIAAIHVVINLSLSALATDLEGRQRSVRHRRTGPNVPVEDGIGQI